MVTTAVAGKPCWSREAAIGDYGGALDKRECSSEKDGPPAWLWYRELVALQGSAYSSQIGGTLVHARRLAVARMLAFICNRAPEMAAANSTPATADDGLPYWVKVLGLPSQASDQKWQTRQRAAVHYKIQSGITLEDIETGIDDLIGDAFVDASFSTSGDLSAPPTITYWPGINPGPADYDLGGGTWLSERSHLFVEVQQPAGLSDIDYRNLINVQLYTLLDRMLPAHVTFSAAEGDGFVLSEDQLDFAGVT